MKREDFQYTTTFEEIIYASSDIENELHISTASLEELKPLIPKSVNLKTNIDLLGTAFNAAVVNKFNKNHEGISSEQAVDLVKYFIHKPTNIEHKTKKIVGHIVNAGFSDIDSRIITQNEAMDKNDPYHLSLSAVVYKTVYEDFAEALLDSNDEDSPFYKKISASWELGFNDYYIALGSENVKDAEIVKDKKQIESLKQYLKKFGGNGALKDGTIIRRLIVGQIYPLGIGYTSNPAADVKGVFAQDGKDIVFKEDESSNIHKEKQYNTAINIPQISHIQKNNVNFNKDTNIMDTEQLIKEIGNLLDSKLSQKKQFSEESVASVASFISEKIKEKDVEFKAEKERIEQEKATAAQEAEQAKSSLKELESKLSSTEAKLNELESAIAAQKATELFNSRMDAVEQLFDLDNEDRSIIAKEIQALDSKEESFASYQGKLNTFLAYKSKENKAKEKEAFDQRVAEEVEKRVASLAPKTEDKGKETVEDLLEKTKASEAILPNNNSDATEQKDLVSRFKNAFNKENIEIKL